jgi:hypothetical protein
VTDDALPPWTHGLVVDGIRVFGRRWRVRVADGAAVDEPTDS